MSRETDKFGLIPKSQRAKEYHKKVYHRRREKYLRQVKKIIFSILVWGPGEKGKEDLYKKRLDIVNYLRLQEHDAFFSEEEDPEMGAGDYPTVKAREFIQALAADLIVILRCSFGSTAELHDFADYEELASRMLLFIDRETNSSYSNQGVVKELGEIYRDVYQFSYPDDIQACNVASKVLYRVRLEQHREFRRRKHKKSRR